MKIFQSFQKNSAYLGISSDQLQRKHHFNIENVFGLSVMGFASVSNIYFLSTTTDSIGEHIFSLYMTSLTIGVSLAFSVVVWKMKSVFKFINGIEKVIDSRSCYPMAEIIYTKTDQLNEKLSEIIYFAVVKVSSPYLVMPKFLYSFYIYIITDFSNDSFALPIPTWLPFDWKHPMGYVCASALQFLVGVCMFSIIANLLSLGIGAFLFAVCATNDITINLGLINDSTKTKRNRKKIFKYLSDFVQFHGDVKDLLHTFMDVFQPIFMWIFVWSIVCICGTLLMFQMQISHNEYGELLETGFEACYAFGLVFVPCELGERLTSAFWLISDTVERFNWYRFPLKMKKILPIIINVAQVPVVLDCFGSTACVRGSFKKVVNSGFSYFMILRQFFK